MIVSFTIFVASLATAQGFSSALFHEAPTLQRTTPSQTDGVDIELPDFDELFDRIQQVSPLAREVISRNGVVDNGPKGFQAIDDHCKFSRNNWRATKKSASFVRLLTPSFTLTNRARESQMENSREQPQKGGSSDSKN